MTAKTAPKITLWEFFQQLGKTFMLPVALLSFCGIMLGIGSSLSSHDVITLLPWLNVPLLQAIFVWMSKVGSFAFSFLPVMFCIAIPLGLARENKGVAAFAGFVGYPVMNLAVNFWLTAKGILPTTDAAILKANNIQNIIGIQSIDTGILGAVIAGIIVWMLHERFHNIRLPDALAFFGGTRFVPIITTVVLGLVGLVIPLVWPVFAMGINGLGHVINSAGDFGPMIFGTGERLLLPFGLHHIFYLPFWTTALGGSEVINGQLVEGTQRIFFAQLADPNTQQFYIGTARFMSGRFITMMFGLVGACLAMYQSARPENRKRVGGLLLSAALTSFLTGITEPIEFSFLFVAPALYVVHALFDGLAFMIAHILHITIGQTFSGGFIDFMLFGVLQGEAKTHWMYVPLAGVPWFFLYYFTFRFLIVRFNFKTPGREAETSPEAVMTGTERSQQVLAALGGKENIVELDCCATRLRVTVKQSRLLDESGLKASGARAVIVRGNGVQVIYGPHVTIIKNEVEELLDL